MNGSAGHRLRMLGYSLGTILSVFIVGVLLVLAVLVVASFRFQTGMPVASSNSMVIATACHLDRYAEDEGTENDVDTATLELQ